MTGSRRSSRLHATPEKAKSDHTKVQDDPKSQPKEGSAYSKAGGSVKKPKKEVIGGVKRNLLDDGLEFYHTHADSWVSGDETPPELLKVWAKKQMRPSSRPNQDQDPDSEVNGVKRDLTVGLLVNYRKKGRNRAGNSQAFQWVPVHAASPRAVSAWAKAEKERTEETIKHLQEHQIPPNIAKHLSQLEDLLDGEIMSPTKPDSAGSSPAEDQDTRIPPHPPHYPLPTTFKGKCDNSTQPSSTLAHTDLVAACQSSKHFSNGPSSSPSLHLVCTACHDNPPTERLDQHERDHIIRDKGLFPLCSFCTTTWSERDDVGFKYTSSDCTCAIQLPQWLCADCWVEMARARSRRADGCDECVRVRSEREKKGEDVIGEGVHMCSGCQALIIKQGQTPTA